MSKKFFHVEASDHLKAEARKYAAASDLTESQFVRKAVREKIAATKKELKKHAELMGIE